ncbi:hypothetical protein [Exiguobacterium acetylicum]|uniref:hypothetical protein n=1 Tax=Exiguobacterium acetylicum TaxID=41170 RepID=UPI001CA63E15|nr:hypothetical protein [Exiguobacterium acetylicum]QZY88231.1 hypothetical protein K7G97_07810 [Exiguobacterium acetylicum]
MLLRHMTHRHHMKSIVTRGGLSPTFQIDAPTGWIAFEVDPPSAAYQTHFHQLKNDWQDGDVVTLEFDGERMQAAGFEMLQSEEDERSHHAKKLGLPLEEIGSYAYIRNFVSLDYLVESSREKISEYY